jgi:hypothetical protein
MTHVKLKKKKPLIVGTDESPLGSSSLSCQDCQYTRRHKKFAMDDPSQGFFSPKGIWIASLLVLVWFLPLLSMHQEDAALLAACNCIGNKAYDNQAIAAFLWNGVKHCIPWQRKLLCVHNSEVSVAWNDIWVWCILGTTHARMERYRQEKQDLCCFKWADNKMSWRFRRCFSENCTQDFRTGRLGPIYLFAIGAHVGNGWWTNNVRPVATEIIQTTRLGAIGIGTTSQTTRMSLECIGNCQAPRIKTAPHVGGK